MGEGNEHAGLNGLAVSLADNYQEYADKPAPTATLPDEPEKSGPVLAPRANADPVTLGFLANPVVKFDDICRCHPDYDADNIKKFRTFYEQNEDFNEEFKRGLLPKLAGEDEKRYAARIARAYKITPEKAMIEFMVATAFAGQEPKITCDQNTEYWESLNEKCGNGHTKLLSVAFNTLRDVYLYHNGYSALAFEDPEAKGDKGYNVTIKHLSAPCVNNWGLDTDCKYTWFRTYCQEVTQDPANPFEADPGIRHRWTIYTKDCCIVYEAVATAKDKKPDAQIVKVAWHDFKRPPIFAVDTSYSVWVMRNIWDNLVALYARRTAGTCAFDDTAYQILYLQLFDEPRYDAAGKALPEMVVRDNASGAMVGRIRADGQREDAKFISPNPAETALQLEDLKALLDSLQMALMATQLEAITKTQNARATATGKLLDARPNQVIGYLAALLVQAMMQELIDALAEYRGKGEKPSIEGIGPLQEYLALTDKSGTGAAIPGLGNTTSTAPAPGATSGALPSGQSGAAAGSGATPSVATTPAGGSVAAQNASTGAASAASTAGPATSAATSATTSGGKGPDAGVAVRVDAKRKNIDPMRIDPQHGTDKNFRQELVEKIQSEGYDPDKPVLVYEVPGVHRDGGSIYASLDGHHRAAASRQLKLKKIPAWVVSYADYTKLLNAKFGGVRPNTLSDLDQHIFVDGQPYTEVREANSHTNNSATVSQPTTAAVSFARRNGK